MQEFSSQIGKIGINPVVDPPNSVLDAIFEQAGRSKGAIPVRGKINGSEFIQTLVKYQGVWRLYINGPMLKGAGLDVGDTAKIAIEFDPRPREVPMPAKLAKAFRRDRNAKTAFEALAPSRRNEILKYLGFLKSDEALDRNIDRVLKQLAGKTDDVPPVYMRGKK